MKSAFAGLLILATTVLAQAQPAAAPATRATAPQQPDVAAIKYDKAGKPNGKFLQLHEEFLERARQGNVDLLFLGDSITAGWNGQKGTWETYFGKYNAANFGIGGDRTQHVLWRIENGELEGIKPKVVVLMIGTNNLSADKPDRIADGIEKIVATIREKLPESKVLLLGIFPRGAQPDDPNRARIKTINEQIAKLDDGGKTVRYLDIGEKFLEPDGTITKQTMPDFLHLSRHGYQTWAEAIDAALGEMMK